MKRDAVSLDAAEELRVEGLVRSALGALPGESILDAARRTLAAKPDPTRSVKRLRVATVIANGTGAPDPWATLRRAARMVES